MTENWRAVPGFEGTYEVSDLGRVRSLDRVVEQRHHSGCMMRRLLRGRLRALTFDTDGYFKVALHDRERSRMFPVHALVALAFHGPKPEGFSQIRHLDGVKTNNTPGNLKYGTNKENAQDALAHGGLKHSEAHYRSKVTRKEVAEIRELRGRARQIDLADQYGLSQPQISAIQLGRTWAHV